MRSTSAQDDLLSDDPFYTVVGNSIQGSYIPATSEGPSSAGSASGSVMSVTSGGITINLILDAAAQAAPASFKSGLQQAVGILAANITDKITVNINIDYSGTGGGAAAGPDNGVYENYSWVRSELVNNASVGDTTFKSLPTGTTIQGQSNVAVWNAQLKLWGVLGANDTTTDDASANFSTDINPNLLVGVALHELTHAMGRVPYGSAPDVFDFYRFTSPGVRLFSGGNTAPAAYFSLDGGNTKLADYGRNSDSSDFLNGGVQGSNDPFDEYYTSSSLQKLTAIDLKQLDALGFHLGINAPIVDTPVVGVSSESSITAHHGNVYQLSSLFSASDPLNKPLVYYVYDAPTGPNAGHFSIAGVAQSNGHWITVTQAQLSQTTFTAGRGGASDTLIMIADNGSVQGHNSVTIDALPDQAPVVSDPSGGAVNTHSGNSIQLSTLFSASDPDSDPLSYYVYDESTGASAGHFSIAGVAQSNGHWIAVSQAQLSQTTFVAGQSGTSDTLIMIADDGVLQGYESLTVSASLVNHAPVVSDSNGAHTNAAAGQSIELSTLFSASDPDSDPLSYYVYDESTGASAGHFSIAGVAQSNGHWIAASQAQLSQTTFVAGQSGTSDTLIMIADDGVLQGYESLTVSASLVNQAPVVSDSNGAHTNAAAGQSIELSTMFSASDPDSDPLSYYVYDESTGASAGHFSIAGVAQSNGHWIAVSQAQLSQTTFVAGGSGASDTLIMIADDGSQQGYNSVEVSVGASARPAVPDLKTLPAGDTFGLFRDLPPGPNGSQTGSRDTPPGHLVQAETGLDLSHNTQPHVAPEIGSSFSDLHVFNVGAHDFLIM